MPRVDLHFHLLPGLDDGSRSIEESVELAHAAAREGTSTIVTTPHVRGDFVTDVSVLPERVRAVAKRLAEQRVPVSLRCGAELGHDMVGRLSQADLETVALGPPGARWVLVETPFEGIDAEVHAALDELRDRGFAIVLGHPERSAGLLNEERAALRRELACGTLIQVNAWSLAGRHGPQAEAIAARLATEDLIDVIASDAHSLARPPALATGLRAALDCGLPATRARRLIDATPARLLKHGAKPRTTALAP